MIKGTQHAQIHRGEKAKERRRVYRLQKLIAHSREIPLPKAIQQGLWSKIKLFFTKIYAKIRVLGHPQRG